MPVRRGDAARLGWGGARAPPAHVATPPSGHALAISSSTTSASAEDSAEDSALRHEHCHCTRALRALEHARAAMRLRMKKLRTKVGWLLSAGLGSDVAQSRVLVG